MPTVWRKALGSTVTLVSSVEHLSRAPARNGSSYAAAHNVQRSTTE